MAKIGRCKTCRFWIKPIGKAVWGDCDKIKTNESLIEISVNHMSTYSYGDGVIELDIHPDFGCMLWEHK